MKTIDLHTHSIRSDGSFTPSDLVRHGKENGLAALALTDHDSIDGVEEAMRTGEEIGMEVVPGIEFSVQSKTETHILGYYIDIHHPSLLEALEQIRRERRERNHMVVENLRKLGFDVSLEEVFPLAPNGLIGRAHFAKLLVQKGYVSSVKEAFDLYLSNGKPAYASNQSLSPQRAVQLIKEAGGCAFVAHLHLIRMEDAPLREFLSDLKKVGLDGIEGYYTEYTPEMQETYQRMAKELGLLLSGGTDFHGAMKPHISIGTGYGNLAIPYTLLEQIKARSEQHE